MPAKDYLEKFQHDPATFDYERFKAGLLAEIATDDDLNAAKITGLETERSTLSESERDLKIRLFDATIAKQGEPVVPTDSPANSAAGNSTTPVVTDADIFG